MKLRYALELGLYTKILYRILLQKTNISTLTGKKPVKAGVRRESNPGHTQEIAHWSWISSGDEALSVYRTTGPRTRAYYTKSVIGLVRILKRQPKTVLGPRTVPQRATMGGFAV